MNQVPPREPGGGPWRGSRPSLAHCIRLLLFFSVVVRGRGAGSGELDPSFQPPPEAAVAWDRLLAHRGELYYSRGVHFRRLREDGSLDPAWALGEPAVSFPSLLAPTLYGGWVIGGLAPTAMRVDTEGSPGQVLRRGFLFSESFLPQADNGVVVDGRERYLADGRRDRAFAYARRLRFAPFHDGLTPWGSGGLVTRAAEDGLGRQVVVGNFREVGDQPRVGLVRFLPDGRQDPTWNPGPALGFGLNETNGLTRLAHWVAVNADGLAVIGFQSLAVEGVPDSRLAIVAPNGAVLADLGRPDPGMNRPAVVQPDGRILVPGSFDNWNGVPATGLVRLQPDGTLDTGFSVPLERNGPVSVTALASDGSGRVWIAGEFDTVHGVARTNLARIVAWVPAPAAPVITLAHAPARAGTNELLHVSVRVSGVPPPRLQWYRDGVLLPGATNAGLRIPTGNPAGSLRYSLTAENASGSSQLVLPEIPFALRSPPLGQLDPAVDVELPGLLSPLRILPAPEGGYLLTGGLWIDGNSQFPMLARLDPGGRLVPGFGIQGVVSGNGAVEDVRALPGGGWLVGGQFTALAGFPASGVAVLNAMGDPVLDPLPALEPAHVTAVLPDPRGGFVAAGLFNRVDGVPRPSLVRVGPDGKVVPGFLPSLLPGQIVDAMEWDSEGRLLVAGEQVVRGSNPLPPPLGLVRLMADGTPDPAFQRLSAGVRRLVVEPGGTLLAGLPPRRLDRDGRLITEFQSLSFDGFSLISDAAIRVMIRLPDGGVLTVRDPMLPRELVRWRADGTHDFDFVARTGESTANPRLQAATLAPDGSVLLVTLGSGNRLRRLLPDPDQSWADPRLVAGQFRASLATQEGQRYGVRSGASLTAGGLQDLATLLGDGFWTEVSMPATAGRGFLELRRGAGE